MPDIPNNDNLPLGEHDVEVSYGRNLIYTLLLIQNPIKS